MYEVVPFSYWDRFVLFLHQHSFYICLPDSRSIYYPPILSFPFPLIIRENKTMLAKYKQVLVLSCNSADHSDYHKWMKLSQAK